MSSENLQVLILLNLLGRYLSKILLPFRSLMMADLQVKGIAGSPGAALRPATAATKTADEKSFIFLFFTKEFLVLMEIIKFAFL